MKDHQIIAIEIKKEIDRQDAKWGPDRTNPSPLWVTVLLEEVGEVARAVLEKDNVNAREELIQVAALAVQMVDAIDRNEFKR